MCIQRIQARRPKTKLLSTYLSDARYVGGGGGSPNLIDANNPKIESVTTKKRKQTIKGVGVIAMPQRLEG